VAAFYGMGVNYVSPNDVADATVVVLLNPKPYRNKTYNQTVPGPTRDEQVVKLLTKHYGTPIEYKYKDSIIERGLPE
jgi:nucleoside-diphosphate-sugar epimerase